MFSLLDPDSSVVGETVATAIGRVHRDDPVAPSTGGPAGNARLTAWVGLVLLAVFLLECVTLISLNSLLAMHIFVGAFLLPLVLLKTATTGWRMIRYYTRSAPYVQSGPPPVLLRLLGPLVVFGALAVLGTGISLVALGRSGYHNLFTLMGFGISALTLHKAAFVLWLGTTGLHVLGRFVPALQLSILTPATRASHGYVPGAKVRLGLAALTVATAIVTGVLVLHFSGDWTNAPWR